MNRVAAWAVWPVGMLLVLAYTLGEAFPAPVFVVLDVLYLGGIAFVVRALGGSSDRSATALVLAGGGIFALAGLTGAPTARDPWLMLLNAAVLGAVAVTLLVVAVRLALRCTAASARGPALLGVVALVIGSGVYLVNLVARWAVVLSGAAAVQAGVEDTYWVANTYLPGLTGEPGFLAYLLVLFDLLQVGYVVLTYLGFGALATALGRVGVLPGARRIAAAGWVLAALAGLGAVLAPALPAAGGTVAAWTAFVLTIPFMSTLLPYAIGIGLLRARARRSATFTPAV